ncbi:MAG: two-component system response regulator [Acidobacteria bacterium]|nr:two-component system response regulator [Acidobacteriota bacterium]
MRTMRQTFNVRRQPTNENLQTTDNCLVDEQGWFQGILRRLMGYGQFADKVFISVPECGSLGKRIDMADRNRPVEILLVEDSPSDTDLTIEALRAGDIPSNLSHVEDGVEAMEFLGRKNAYAGAPRPDLILLDLNLPRKDGRELLLELKSDPDLRTIPVVVLTTSKDDRDISQAYQLQANCYIAKPVDFAQFVDVLRAIEHFWLEVAALPGKT